MQFDDETKTIICTNKKDAFFLFKAIEYYLNADSKIMTLTKVGQILNMLPDEEGFRNESHWRLKYNTKESLVSLDFSYELKNKRSERELNPLADPALFRIKPYFLSDDGTRMYDALKQIKDIKN